MQKRRICREQMSACDYSTYYLAMSLSLKVNTNKMNLNMEKGTLSLSNLKELTTELLEISISGMWPTQPYPESFALKSLSICMLEVENSLYMACINTRGAFSKRRRLSTLKFSKVQITEILIFLSKEKIKPC